MPCPRRVAANRPKPSSANLGWLFSVTQAAENARNARNRQRKLSNKPSSV